MKINMKKLRILNNLNKRFYRKSTKFHLELTVELDELIIGCKLGDLSAEKRNINSNTRLQFKQSTINIDYVGFRKVFFIRFYPSATHLSLFRRMGTGMEGKSYGFLIFFFFFLPLLQ
uniref:hypothetical protein n=1 Tax=Porodaedalea chrysoloma TaxID=74615 RepID=UPI0023AA59D5|nr:hypothetical protein P1S03_mgp18 [Porodaedalea chrysoloma]WCF76788.1 hypothetical protein [Porodaedalea chrysoloma]